MTETLPTSKCQSCEAPIIWVETVKDDGTPGKKMPLDAEPIGRAMVRFGPDGSRARFSQTWKSHFATCPYAKQHRTKGAKP